MKLRKRGGDLPPVAYILTGGYAAGVSPMLAAISMRLLRLIHPAVKIRLLMDPETTKHLDRIDGDGFLFRKIAESITIETDASDGIESNRFIKTQLPRWMEGPFLYLDNDTLPVRNFDGIYDRRFDFAAAPDFLDGTQSHVCPERFRELYEDSGWDFPPARYLNGGVFAANGGANAKSLFQEWHRRWDACRERGIPVDQPALNSLWADGKWNLRVLPKEYNALIEVDERFSRRARVYHYTSSYAQLSGYLLMDWIAKLEKGEEIEAELTEFLRTAYPWKDESHARRHWLTGNHVRAARVFLKKKIQREGAV